MFAQVRTAFFFLVFLSLLNTSATAHLPRFFSNNPCLVSSPESSQAFYATLNGGSHHYIIRSESPFRLYVAIMVPDLTGIDKDVEVTIKKTEGEAETTAPFPVQLSPSQSDWPVFYEQFVGDNYLMGPSFQVAGSDSEIGKGVLVGPGTYDIEVISTDNVGKYVLAIGDAEQWSLPEIWNALILLPRLKLFFEKSVLLSFSTPTTLLFLAILIALSTLLIYVLIKIWGHFYPGTKPRP